MFLTNPVCQTLVSNFYYFRQCWDEQPCRWPSTNLVLPPRLERVHFATPSWTLHSRLEGILCEFQVLFLVNNIVALGVQWDNIQTAFHKPASPCSPNVFTSILYTLHSKQTSLLCVIGRKFLPPCLSHTGHPSLSSHGMP